MRYPSRTFIRPYALFGAFLATAGCGGFADDSEQYNDLQRLRLLAVRAEPADLAFGETATLSALVFEPDNRDVSYEWSWCPSRADASGEFECNISESQMEELWDALALPGDPPSYDLGTDPEVQFTNLMSPELVAALCQNLVGDIELSEQLALACFMGLEASVKVTVRTSKGEVTAIKSLSLLMQDVPAEERNTNPALDFAMSATDQEDETQLDEDESLVAGRAYKISADLDEATAETFTPTPAPGQAESDAEPRRETLVASWFVTIGEIVAAKEDDPFGGDPRTTFVDEHNEFQALLDNGWKLPLTAKGDAQVYFVVRDERGGVGWTHRQFDIKGVK